LVPPLLTFSPLGTPTPCLYVCLSLAVCLPVSVLSVALRQIGDFGTSVRLASLEAEAVAKASMERLPSMLATEGSDSESTMSMSSVQLDVGTSLYASPEQCSLGTHKTTDRSDIYSLGIILFELYWITKSAEERTVLISKLRAGSLPRKMFRLYPKEAATILWLVSDSPEDRPSAAELLESELLQPPSVSILCVR
jgi:serine/threonine protein kinase